MKTLINLCAFFSVVFANAEDYCHVIPTQEQKEVIYSELNIPFHVPFVEVCEEYKKLYRPVEIEGGFHKVFIGKITCGAGCAFSLLGMFFVPDAEDSIVRLKKEKPYSYMIGKNLTYRFGGAEAEYYTINNRDDYDHMISDVRSKLNNKYSSQSSFWGSASTLTCNCTWSIPF